MSITIPKILCLGEAYLLSSGQSQKIKRHIRKGKAFSSSFPGTVLPPSSKNSCVQMNTLIALHQPVQEAITEV